MIHVSFAFSLWENKRVFVLVRKVERIVEKELSPDHDQGCRPNLAGFRWMWILPDCAVRI